MSAFPFADIAKQKGSEWCVAILSVVSDDFASFADRMGHTSEAVVDRVPELFASFTERFVIIVLDADWVLGGAFVFEVCGNDIVFFLRHLNTGSGRRRR